MTITTEQCEARIYADAELMAQTLNDSDFAGFLTCSYTPMRDDDLEFGQRVKDFIEAAVTRFAENMAKEINRDTAEHEYDASRDEALDDPRNAPGYAAYVARS